MKKFLPLATVLFPLLLNSCAMKTNGWNDNYVMPGIINTASMKLISNQVTLLSIDGKPVKLFAILDSIQLTPGWHDIALYIENNPFNIARIKKLMILRTYFVPNELYLIKSDADCHVWIQTQEGFLVSSVRFLKEIQDTVMIHKK